MTLPEETGIRVLTQLKRIMKENDLTYAALAQHLDVSVATVKRLLNASDISLVRLKQVCNFVDVDPAEILSAASPLKTQGKM